MRVLYRSSASSISRHHTHFDFMGEYASTIPFLTGPMRYPITPAPTPSLPRNHPTKQSQALRSANPRPQGHRLSCVCVAVCRPKFPFAAYSDRSSSCYRQYMPISVVDGIARRQFWRTSGAYTEVKGTPSHDCRDSRSDTQHFTCLAPTKRLRIRSNSRRHRQPKDIGDFLGSGSVCAIEHCMAHGGGPALGSPADRHPRRPHCRRFRPTTNGQLGPVAGERRLAAVGKNSHLGAGERS